MEKSSFFNSVNGDRRYKADDYANYFNKFITNGYFPNVGSNLQVIADGTDMTIKLKPGAAWINGYMYENTDNLTLPVTVADGVLNRIDRVVIQLNFSNRSITAKVKKGVFSSTSVAPALQRDADIYELGIADIFVSKGITSIKQSTVTDLRLNTTLCGVVGSLAQPDTTAIFNQYQSWFQSLSAQNEYNSELTLTKFKDTLSGKELEVFNLFEQFRLTLGKNQQEFNSWFNSLQDVLDGNTATNLLNKINNKIIVSENPPPVSERENDSFYFHITSSAPVGSSQEIKVSPTMGIKFKE